MPAEALMELPDARGVAVLRWPDQLAPCHGDAVQLAVDVPGPEVEELAQLGIVGIQIVMLPDKGLQQARMVGQVVDDLGGGEAIALELQLQGSPVRSVHPLNSAQPECAHCAGVVLD